MKMTLHHKTNNKSLDGEDYSTFVKKDFSNKFRKIRHFPLL